MDGFKSAQDDGRPCNITLGVPSSQCKTTIYNNQRWHYHYPSEDKYQFLYESYPEVINPIEGATSELFIVWMRTAGLPNFRKLYGKIHSDFKKGDKLNFRIKSNFEVNSFDGSKSLVISTLGNFGGKNSFLGLSYIVVGGVSLVLAIGFSLKTILHPRELGDTHFLGWDT